MAESGLLPRVYLAIRLLWGQSELLSHRLAEQRLHPGQI